MHTIRSFAMALAALAIVGFSAPAFAVVVNNPPPIVIHLGDVEQENAKPWSVTTPGTGSIGTHGGAQGHPQEKCTAGMTAYDDYYGFCQAAVFNVTSLSERSPGAPTTKSGVNYSCTTTSYTSTSVYDGSGPVWNPGNWDTTYSSTEATVDGHC